LHSTDSVILTVVSAARSLGLGGVEDALAVLVRELV
jgi:hypothetical protein